MLGSGERPRPTGREDLCRALQARGGLAGCIGIKELHVNSDAPPQGLARVLRPPSSPHIEELYTSTPCEASDDVFATWLVRTRAPALRVLSLQFSAYDNSFGPVLEALAQELKVNRTKNTRRSSVSALAAAIEAGRALQHIKRLEFWRRRVPAGGRFARTRLGPGDPHFR